MGKEDQPSISYISNLDGLRALAVSLVLLDHWAPFHVVHDLLEFGRVGLLLFFMLSGYLITTVLLTLKGRLLIAEINLKTALTNFYMRRVIRILPIYILALVIAFLVEKNVREDFLFHLLFLQNLSALTYASQPIYGIAMHLWSLAVEEQFYLVCAPVILMIGSSRQMIKVCVSAIAIALIFKIYSSLADTSYWNLRINTLGNIDSLAIGCLVAIDKRYSLINWEKSSCQSLIKTIFFLSIISIIFLVSLNQVLGFKEARALTNYKIFHDTLMQIPIFILLFTALYKKSPLLSHPSLVWIGKRSYGIYVWHQFIRYGVILVFSALFSINLEPKYSLASFIAFTITTLVASSISWNFIEKPFLSLKSKWK